MAEPLQIGGWTRREILGYGSFGQISVWEEITTKTVIAVKAYKGTASDLKEKQREYWIKEVEIMHKLDHPNVVRAVKLPETLKNYFQLCVPPLSMEYSRGGDLRRMLLRSENLCGLAEKDVRNILRDICKGLIYLHKERIIHRDLKPENIVIHLNGENQRVYKIIDLGYAKELGQASLAQSFVGTIAYLAPELFEQRPYNYTVDYWSLGILAFEIATGIRPFCFNESAVPDLTIIRKKKDKHIYIMKTSKIIEFSSTLPDWCRLNNTFKHDLTVWLQTMLAYDPKNRSHEAGSPSSLERMISLLNRPMAHVLNTNALKVVTFTVSSTPDDLYMSTMVPTSSQVLLSANGREITFDDLLGLAEPHLEDASLTAYLFHFGGNYNLTPNGLPHDVRSILANNSDLMTYTPQKYLWQRMHNHVVKEFTSCCQILSAYRALLVRINAVHSELSTMLNNLSSTYKEVKVFAQIQQEDQEYDLKQMQKIQHSALEELRSVPGRDLMKAVSDIKEKMRKIVTKANTFHRRVVKLRENPFGGSKPPAVLATLHDSVFKLFEGLRVQGRSAERNKLHSNNVMVSKVQEFTEEQARVLKEISGHIVDALGHLKELRETLCETDDFIKEVTKHRARRTVIWNIYKKLMINETHPSNPTSPASETNGTIDSLSMALDVKLILRENEKYRNALNSLNDVMESEVDVTTGSILQSQGMTSFL
ncbi:inhibitor of nuclear factor kappa-B kinase subunit alpha-like [Tropilaelaps mercedesae]|uniref:IkappaB kinase n=1 Tax=Tropilaelaps mercedesae TaxID=418985 RepID=A0A1V9XP12_9ACAR|nr:inhibitor of nuclear factor kappa-B kinase subunit alpha-like [Tropilaelaps mercedesae]